MRRGRDERVVREERMLSGWQNVEDISISGEDKVQGNVQGSSTLLTGEIPWMEKGQRLENCILRVNSIKSKEFVQSKL